MTIEPFRQAVQPIGVRRRRADLDRLAVTVEEMEVKTLATEIQTANLCLSTGRSVVATASRSTTAGTRPRSSWLEVPEYSMLTAELTASGSSSRCATWMSDHATVDLRVRALVGLLLTINGAVEKVLIRGDRRIRVGLAGPGKAFGYESLIDGHPSPVTAVTRESALLLVLPLGPFEQLFNGENAVSRVFLDVIQRELVATLRLTLRPHARLAAGV